MFIIHCGALPSTTVDATQVGLITGPIETIMKAGGGGAHGEGECRPGECKPEKESGEKRDRERRRVSAARGEYM